MMNPGVLFNLLNLATTKKKATLLFYCFDYVVCVKYL